MSFIRSENDLTNLRHSCTILASIFWHIRHSLLRPGLEASVIDHFIADFAQNYKAKPSFKGYKGYPYNCNFSIDHEVTHAFPAPGRVVPQNGLLKIDIGVQYKGMISDKCETFVLGNVPDRVKQLSQICQDAMNAGIHTVRAGIRLGDIGHAVDSFAKKHRLGNVQVLGGHGVGYAMHDDPWIPHYGKPGKGVKLLANQVITIEPMFNLGGDDVVFSETDGWTVTTADNSLSAQWEETVLVTAKGQEILTRISEEKVLPLTQELKEKYAI